MNNPKTQPAAGEPKLIHRTIQTGKTETLALTAANFNPDVIREMPDMERRPWRGYRLLVNRQKWEAGEIWFIVLRQSDRHKEGTSLTSNVVRRDGNDLILETSILPDAISATIDELMMLADLEQCAAIALAPPPPANRLTAL